jgi:S-adenosylmethionine decarboxylase
MADPSVGNVTLTISRHIIADITSEDPFLLDDAELILEALTLAAKEAHATILKTAYHRFSPHGVTAFLLLSESHISIHTWPELNKAALDIYTCGDHTDPDAGLETILSRLRATCLSRQMIQRQV